MKKVFLLFLFSISVFAYNNIENITSGLMQFQNKSVNVDQEKLQTLADFQDMVNTLKNAYTMGDKSKAYIIGNIYMQEHKLVDSVVKPDKKEAMKWFKRGLDAGYGLNALPFALSYYLSKKEFYNALDVLEKGIKSKFVDYPSQVSLSIAYAGIVLDHLHKNKKYVEKAIDLLYPIVSRKAISSLDYVFANLLNLDNRTKLANKYLNSACNNPKVPPQIWNMCIQGEEIKAVDTKTGQPIKRNKKNNCPIKKLMPGYN